MIAALARRLATWEAFLAVMALGLLGYAIAAVPNFTSSFNLSQAAAGVSEKALLVLPMVLLIIAREIDLSIASILALTSVILGVLVRAEVPLLLAVPLVLAVGAALGAFNGLLVTRLDLPSLVVTLGTLAMFRGIGYIILGSGSVNRFPDALTDLGVENVPGTAVPWTIVPFLVLAPVFALVLQHTPTGRRIYAVGGNPDAALYAGVRSRRLRFLLFVLSGLVCAVAGIVFTARLANARANNALGFELDVITIALLGGVSVFGGRGTLTGVIWALLLVATLRNVLGLQQIGGDAQGIAIGLLLIGSLLLSNTVERILDRIRTRRLLGGRLSLRPQAEPASGPNFEQTFASGSTKP
ncbi:MAG: ABC transporter permease [Geminicoccaceae bacterium]